MIPKLKFINPYITIIFSTLSLWVIGYLYFYKQPKIYQSFWYDTNYIITLYADSTYQVKTEGHLGFLNLQGKYKINQDTIYLISGYEQSSGTINEKYLKLGDSIIVDLESFWDYKITGNNKNAHSGRKHFDIFKKPNLDTLVLVDEQTLDKIIQQCITFLDKKDISEIFYNTHDEHNHIHTGILRLLNTFKDKPNIFVGNKFYTAFAKIIKETKYEETVIKKLFDWIPCKDGGHYSRQLKIEFGGEIHPYSKYTITNNLPPKQ